MTPFLPISMEDYVKSGEAVRVLPNTDSGHRSYGAGRLFAAVATGGTVTTDGDYTVHKFTTSADLVCTGSIQAEVLVVAGGGGGSSGGGGAGGYLTGTETLTGTMPVTVGDGGLGKTNAERGGTGGDSVFGTRTAKGGGGGGAGASNGGDGGSGGGAGQQGVFAGVATPAGQGNDGGTPAGYAAPTYPAGGGGGAGAIGGSATSGSVAGNGGAGIDNDIVETGVNVGYAGGGGGSTFGAGTAGTASHGGGAGNNDSGNGTAGTANTGGGGGGAGFGRTGGNGGSGIVVVRYLTANLVSSLIFTDIVTVASTGVTAAGTNVAYSRNSAGTYFGPVVVTASAYSAGEQTILAANWSDPVALFRYVKVGDYLLPLNGDSVAYQKVA